MQHAPFVAYQDGYLLSVRARDEPAAAELMDAVNRFALRPLDRDEIAVFTLELCNNQIDKHFSRFPDEELARVNEMAPGRPLIERHDLRGSLPRGTFFRSRLHRDGDVLTVRPEVYVLRTRENEDFILNIEGGVYREISIGFSFERAECSVCAKDIRACRHVPGRTYEGARCHFLMRDVIDVLEGSVVAAGSQGTQFVSAAARVVPERLKAVPRCWARE